MKQLSLFEQPKEENILLQLSNLPNSAYVPTTVNTYHIHHDLQYQTINSRHSPFYSYLLAPGHYNLEVVIRCHHSYTSPSAGIWEFKLGVYGQSNTLITQVSQHYCSHAMPGEIALISLATSNLNLPTGGDLQISVASCTDLILDVDAVEIHISEDVNFL